MKPKRDNTNYTILKIIISPLAKGNAYASSVEINHSSISRRWRKFSDSPT